MSQRRACGVLQLDPTSYRYKSRRPAQAVLEAKIKEIWVRYGYRRVHVLLRRDGWMINKTKTQRIYRELGLQLRAKTPKRRVKAKLRDDRKDASHAHETWAMDFVHDQLATGSKVRILTVVDLFSRFSPVIDPRQSYRGEDVVATLERVCADVGYPRSIGRPSPAQPPDQSAKIPAPNEGPLGSGAKRAVRSKRSDDSEEV